MRSFYYGRKENEGGGLCELINYQEVRSDRDGLLRQKLPLHGVYLSYGTGELLIDKRLNVE